MESQGKQPEIKLEVNKEEEKKTGLLASLLALLGRSSGGGSGAGPGLAGGLLATKAGIVGLILVGTTVAGGLGVVSYKVFGPGASDRVGARFSLFSPRPKAADSQAEGAAASKDGTSPSLDYLVKANQGAIGEAGEAAEAASLSATGEQASAQGPIGTAQNLGAAPGARANPSLKSDKKFGELSKDLGGKAATGASSPAAASGSSQALLASAKLGQAAGMGQARAASGSGRRALAGARSGTAFRQLGAVRQDHVGAQSSMQAGRTYDGGRVGTTIAGDQGIAGTGAGAGQGEAGTNPSVTAGPSASERFPTPPSVKGKNVTPWQKAIDMAAILIAAAILLLLVGGKVEEPAFKYVLAGLAAVLGLWALVLGTVIAGGKYGQTFQGNMFILAGGFVAASATVMVLTSAISDMGSAWKYVMYASGALALVAALTGWLYPRKVYSPSEFNNGKPPDRGLFGRHQPQAPSEDSLREFLA